MNIDNENFLKWVCEFRNSERCKIANQILNKNIKALLKKQKDPTYLNNPRFFEAFVEYRVLENCFLAKTYHADKDPVKLTRDKYDSNFLKEMKSQIKKIEDLKKFCRNYFEETRGISDAAYLELNRILLEFNNNDQSVPTALRASLVEILLDCLCIGFKQPLRGMKNFPHEHRRWKGALLYPEDKLLDRKGKKIENPALNSLAFRLTALFRIISSGFQTPWKFNIPMPDIGDPCFPLVTELVNVTLDDNKGEDNIEKIIRRLKKNKVHIYYSTLVKTVDMYLI